MHHMEDDIIIDIGTENANEGKYTILNKKETTIPVIIYECILFLPLLFNMKNNGIPNTQVAIGDIIVQKKRRA